MIKTIVFDAYGTLISTGTGSIDATEKILKLRNRTDIDAKEFYSKWKEYHREHIDGLKQFVNEEIVFRMDLKRLYSEYKMDGDLGKDVHIMLETLGKRVVFEEVNNVLKALSADYTLCIGSTTDTEPLIQDMQRNGICVDKVYTSDLLKVYKPKYEFYQSILNDFNIRPQEMLFVGDSLIDDVWGP